LRAKATGSLLAAAAVAAAALLGADAASRPPAPAAVDPLAAARLRAHAEFLADDLLGGRFTGTPTYEIAARYLAAQLQQLGLRPVGGDSYLLPVPLVAASVDVPSAVLEIDTVGGRRALPWADGFVVDGHPLLESSEVEAPVVFVGFGVEAPELKWDDYARLDVRGKVVLALRGAPARFPHDERAYHAKSSRKRAVAAAHGAAGLLLFREAEEAAQLPWERYAINAGKRPSMAWLEPDGTPHGVERELRALAGLSESGADALLAAAGRTRADAEGLAAEPGRGVELGVSVRLAYRSQHRRIESSNVAALLPGSDPALADEVVVVSAHLDHLGDGAAVDGDSIYNGFYDNAMGSSLLVETARALATAHQRPRRSLLFLAVTAEERGLLGSQQFATHPPAGLGRMVANVNLDMPLFLYPVADLVAYGAEHSSLAEPVERAAHAAGFTLSPDPQPKEVIFVRSDQYSFVERGVPAVFLVPGFASRDPQIDGGKAVRGFLSTDYHQPSDEASLPVDWPSAVRFLRANVLLAREVADADRAPEWKPGDFFGKTFGRAAAAEASSPGRRLER
jgi:Zn-dependent M28 family amino/carboxypeptidase